MPRDTENFLRLMNEQNERIAAREAADQRRAEEEIGTDDIREDRMQERRDRLGQLRAREHPSKRPQNARVISNGSRIGMTPGPTSD